MKNLKYILSILILATMTIVAGCKSDSSDPAPDALALQRELLMNEGKSWIIGTEGIIKDGYDVSSQFQGFSLTIGQNTFTTVNSLASAWPESGNWKFDEDNENIILRSDRVIIMVAVTATTLRLTFTVGGENGRFAGLEGEYEFNLVSQ
ncbi:hypothetical protein JKA74_18025 [Marivirga sp. S37H4]|uniref:Lipocalin-like domain-containing protein n=1 Tax=Marivirga aurantiaca TaxID=2802615 RepID=A0A934X1X8_9BACT|nr:hypothetical protein [Marivirga aurantiaca]MBK6266947.1 hypothetical protein [Marivirga aurantiaca]